jgi:hypothetical protein
MRNRFLRPATAVLMVLIIFLISTDLNSRYPEHVIVSSPSVSTGSDSIEDNTVVFNSGRVLWNMDFTTIKYDSQGNQLWVEYYNGPGNGDENAVAMAVDEQEFIYVSGSSRGYSRFEDEFCTIEYGNYGSRIWVARYHGTGDGDSNVSDMAIDKNGNIYVTGVSTAVDNFYECTTVKYDHSGSQSWAVRYRQQGDTYTQGRAVAIDDFNNVYVTGESLDKNGVQYIITVKYDCAGRQIWTVRHKNDGGARDIALDSAGNVYITGDGVTLKYSAGGKEIWTIPEGSRRIILDQEDNIYLLGTAKYDSQGNQLWKADYPEKDSGNKNLAPMDMTVDEKGNVYVCGWSEGNRPNGRGGEFNDFTTVKYDKNGIQLFTARYGEPENGDNSARALVLDSEGNVYVTGESVIEGDSPELATVKYDSSGHQIWAARYHSPGEGINEANAIGVDKHNNIYITGQSANIKIIQRNQSPFVGVPVYQYPNTTIHTKVGREFSFGLRAEPHFFLDWYEKYDENMLALVKRDQVDLFSSSYPVPVNQWFLFKALKPGETTIFFYYSMGEIANSHERKVFVINIE